MVTVYRYVGPPEILRTISRDLPRARISSREDVRRWIADSSSILDAAGSIIVTYIVDTKGQLWISDRCSEHVACARGEGVLSAGEMTFDVSRSDVTVIEVTNQSTGYCPPVESWPAVAAALDQAAVAHPVDFSMSLEFRRCRCGQTNIVKNDVFECAICGAELSRTWNFS